MLTLCLTGVTQFFIVTTIESDILAVNLEFIF